MNIKWELQGGALNIGNNIISHYLEFEDLVDYASFIIYKICMMKGRSWEI